MSSLVTIDYDFFIRHGMYDEIPMPDGDTMPGELVFDWQMSETRNPLVEEAIWQTRAANFKRAGLDIQEMTKPELDLADFSNRLAGRMGDVTPMSFYGDSHGWAALVARDFSKQHGPLDVINFDAHHDLGYDDAGAILRRNDETGEIHCDDWALIGLAHGWINSYTLVYPDWLGKREWTGSPKSRSKRFHNKISVTTWSEWQSEISNTEVMYFCRSSSWVPPWYDDGFAELREEFGYSSCLDCLLGQAGSPFDTCERREWDWAEVDRRIAEQAEMLARLVEMQP